jgi:hypothetical protein
MAAENEKQIVPLKKINHKNRNMQALPKKI